MVVLCAQGPNAKERDEKRAQGDKDLVTAHFVPVLPQLLNKVVALLLLLCLFHDHVMHALTFHNCISYVLSVHVRP